MLLRIVFLFFLVAKTPQILFQSKIKKLKPTTPTTLQRTQQQTSLQTNSTNLECQRRLNMGQLQSLINAGFFRQLVNPISRQFVMNTKKSKGIYTHICILCLDKVQALPFATPTSWTKALCTVANSSNGVKHLEAMHALHPQIASMQLSLASAFESKSTKSEALSSASFACGTATVTTLTKNPQSQSLITKYANRNNNDTHRKRIAQWLIYQSIPFNVCSSKEFHCLFDGYVPQYTPMARETFIKYLGMEFTDMVAFIKERIKSERDSFFGLPFFLVTHDMWTTLAKDNSLGSSL